MQNVDHGGIRYVEIPLISEVDFPMITTNGSKMKVGDRLLVNNSECVVVDVRPDGTAATVAFGDSNTITLSGEGMGQNSPTVLEEIELMCRWAGEQDPVGRDQTLRSAFAYSRGQKTSMSWLQIDTEDKVGAELSRWMLRHARCALCKEELWDKGIVLMSVPSLAMHKGCVEIRLPIYGDDLKRGITQILEERCQ